MGQRRNAKSVRNFVIFLLILQNCGQARTQTEIEPEPEPDPDPESELEPKPELELQRRRDGLAKFQFSGMQPVKGTVGAISATRATINETDSNPAAPLYVFNFANIYETLYAQLLQAAAAAAGAAPAGEEEHAGTGRGQHNPQAQLLWETQSEAPAVLVTPKPFHVLQQLELDLEEQLAQTTTMKPFNVLEQLSLEQLKQLQKKSNVSFNILEALQKEQDRRNKHTTTVKPFHLGQQLEQDLQVQEQEHAFEVLQPAAAVDPVEPLEQHKAAVPAESTRAKDSQKRKRKRIRRRRKRIRRRRKRKRRRNRKQRKRKRKKRKKKKNKRKGDKDKKKRRKRKKKPAPTTQIPLLGQQAQLIYANPTKHPYYPHHSDQYPPHPQETQQPQYPMIQPTILQLVTTKRPATTTSAPFSKIKYLLRHNNLFKKKKKEWWSHVGHVLYPFIKFVAFFTVLNPFTLGVFLFTLISPVVFGFLGFVALSLLVKPFLYLVFGVKDNVDAIDRRHHLANKRAEQLKLNLRPVTIHKHYYQQKPLHSTPPQHHRPFVDWRRQSADPSQRRHNPLLPPEREALSQEDLQLGFL